MKNLLRTLVVIVLLLVYGNTAHAVFPQTKPSSNNNLSTSLTDFKTSQQLKTLIMQNANRPRVLYYLVNFAVGKRMQNVAADALTDLYRKKNDSAELQTLTAYANWATSSGYPMKAQDSKWSKYTQAKFIGFGLVDISISLKPNSPEVLMLAGACGSAHYVAISNSYSQAGLRKNFTRYLNASRKAIRLAPKWADTHYWYGVALKNYHDALWDAKTPKRNVHLLNQAKTEILIAQRLDPGMKGSCARMLASIAESQGRYAEALRYLDSWVSLQPVYAQETFVQNMRGRLQQKGGLKH